MSYHHLSTAPHTRTHTVHVVPLALTYAVLLPPHTAVQWSSDDDVRLRIQRVATALRLPAADVVPVRLHDNIVARCTHGVPLPEHVQWAPEVVNLIEELALEQV